MATPLDPVAVGVEAEAARLDFQQGRPAMAAERLRALRSRLDRSGDVRPEILVHRARAALGLAAAEYETSGRLDASMELLAEAERLAQQSGASDVTVAIRGQRGLLLLRGGRVRDALAALDGAVAMIDAAEPYDQMAILINRGTAHMEHGSLGIARADFEQCVQIAVQVGDASLELRARHNLGYAEFLSGRIPRALATMGEAEALNEGAPHPIGLLDRARVLREAGLATDAGRLLEQAAGLFAEQRLHQDVGEARVAQAECALVEGDVDRALRLARHAERIFTRRGNLLWQRRARLLVLQCERRAVAARRESTRPPALRRLATQAAELAAVCRAEGRRDLARSAELLALESLLRAGSDPDVVAPSVPGMRAADSLESRMQTREVRALAAMGRGQRARASSEVRAGVDELGDYARRFGSLDLRTATAVHGVALARIGLELADRNESAAEFFAAVERSRAISIRLARIGPPADERTAVLLGELRRCEEDLRDLEGDPDAGDEEARLRARAASLQRDIRARSWELEGEDAPPSRRGRQSPRLGEVRDSARAAGTAFVTYVAHRGRWTAVLASARRPSVATLAGLEDVNELVRRVRADLDALALPVLPPPLVEAVRRSLQSGLARLDELLVAPLGVAGVPLVISCSSSLALIPWSLLPSRRGLPVVVTPSASAWLRKASTARRAAPRVVSVAGPGLVRAEEEAVAVQALWAEADLLTREAATTAAVGEALGGADLVHVAAHGTHQQESPLFSSLRLVDGPLYAYELDTDGGSAACVALSACEAGLATVRPGDEGLGLTSVLLHLGTRSVLAGVARVHDDVAARVMGQVHRTMATGTDSAQALAEALADEEETAPFVAFGATW